MAPSPVYLELRIRRDNGEKVLHQLVVPVVSTLKLTQIALMKLITGSPRGRDHVRA